MDNYSPKEDDTLYDGYQYGEDTSATRTPRSHARRSSNRFYTIHFLLILLYTSISVAVIFSFHTPLSQRRTHAFQGLQTRLTQRPYGMMRDSPYVGSPSQNVDSAWNRLFSKMHLRATSADLLRQNLTSVRLPRGGYLAWLGVYHELHCIKVLRHMNYRDHYHPNVTMFELQELQIHADHCIDLLREAVMCHGDTESLTTFVWSEKFGQPLLSPERPVHKCYDWDALENSLAKRVVDESEMDELKRPREG